MYDEFAARQRAITLRLAGRPVKYIGQALGRSPFWFHKWWRRYLESGAEGLYDLTHATHHVAQRIAPDLERNGDAGVSVVDEGGHGDVLGLLIGTGRHLEGLRGSRVVTGAAGDRGSEQQ